MENNQKKIVIVDDNEEFVNFLGFELEHEGYQTEIARDGMSGLSLIRRANPDLIILDWEMPNMTGIEICRRIREGSDTPILMLTARKSVNDKVEGLDTGANDYLIKPFQLPELLARIRALLRHNKPVPEKKNLIFADLLLDTQTHEAFIDNNKLELSPKEFDLLFLFMQNPRQVLSKSGIYEKVWGWDADGNENAVEGYVHSLRGKLEKEGRQRLIHTRRGAGYILIEE
jgi:two-component system response regulator MprA